MKIDIAQLKFIHYKLREIIPWLEKAIGWELTGTSLFRINDSGPHGTLPLRAVDIRIRDYDVGKAIEALVNKHWLYDYNRPLKPCALLHGKDSNMHLHLQSHPNTTKIRY